MRERTRLATAIDGLHALEGEASDASDLIEMAEAESDAAMVADGVSTLRRLLDEAKRQEIESLLSGEADGRDAFLEVNSGAGGTEAQDWAEMLTRMYTRWAERHDCKVQLLEQSDGEQAGIKSATLQVTGPNAYGWLKTEAGVHRLVRISPFDSAARRQTSFASVWVYPVVDDTIEIEINDADLKVDTFPGERGGRAAREQDGERDPDHACADRDHRRVPDGPEPAPKPGDGDDDAEARMYEAELQRREAAAAVQENAKTEIGWGHQIRSYVLAPYQLVKDLRTGVETGNPDAVLDGDLDAFMAAALAARVGATRSEASAQAQ